MRELIGLGTLGYLPLELRREIYTCYLSEIFNKLYPRPSYWGLEKPDVWNLQNLILYYRPRFRYIHGQSGCRYKQYRFRPTRLPHQHQLFDRFDIRNYVLSLCSTAHFEYAICKVSRSVQLDFQEFFLRKFTFKLDCALALHFFSARLPADHPDALRKVILEVLGHLSCFLDRVCMVSRDTRQLKK